MTLAVTDAPVAAKPKKPTTAHLKVVPESRDLRDRVRAEAVRFVHDLDRGRPLTKPALQKMGADLLSRMGFAEKHLGFAMVCISNEFWREQLMAIDFSRRLLLLPHCLKHAEGCPADYDEFGLDCRKCGACSVADFKVKAEDLGYKVLVAEGSPIVLKIIVSGHIDGIVGVACLNVLEKAIDKVLQVGIFEAALYAGLRIAGPVERYEKMIVDFSRNLGVAFQILNDLKDWNGDEDNKLIAGQDVLAARPTLLLALALEGMTTAERQELLGLLSESSRTEATVSKVRRLFERRQVFAKAESLVEKYRSRAEAVADAAEPTELRELLYFLVDSVLERDDQSMAELGDLVQFTVSERNTFRGAS